MKKLMLTTLFALCMTLFSTAQSMMKPSVMVVPGDAWCNNNGFMLKDGKELYPDYRRALLENADLLNVISKINIIMADRGFPLENLETALKNLKTESVERKLYVDKSGSSLQSSPLDELYRAAAADLVLQLSWTVNKVGPKYSITFNLQALDSYTTKQVTGVQGTGAPSFSADVATLLEEAVLSHMDMFCDRLMTHFNDIKQKGREISIDVTLGKSASCNFSTEFDDYELAEIITRQVGKNAVNRSFSKGPSTETLLQYRSVRMPIADADGIPMDAYAFGRLITRPLRKAPYNLTTKVIAKGLGKAVVIIGEE